MWLFKSYFKTKQYLLESNDFVKSFLYINLSIDIKKKEGQTLLIDFTIPSRVKNVLTKDIFLTYWKENLFHVLLHLSLTFQSLSLLLSYYQKTLSESLGQGWLLSRVRLLELSFQEQNAGTHLFHVHQNIKGASQWFVTR